MPIERSAGTIIFKKNRQKLLFLLLFYPALSHRAQDDYWDFPKGHIEKGENLEETAKREAKEETGLNDLKIIDGFKETVKYFFKFQEKNILKFVTFFLAETKKEKVKISKEHKKYAWLSYEESMNSLKFKNAKEILKKAKKFISKNSI
ncbi:bis(5'-nucleosyl)-tetraphosphatase [Patescibacteria group bacterium]